jgi:hypothetical protein
LSVTGLSLLVVPAMSAQQLVRRDAPAGTPALLVARAVKVTSAVVIDGG